MKIQKVTFALENHPRPGLSALMRSYQAAKKSAKSNEAITISRLNKALGLAMRKTYDRGYITTTTSCNCPDSARHPEIICEHRLALMLIARSLHLEATNA